MIQAAVENTSFVGKATICSILPREDGQDHTLVNRTHGMYHVWHPKAGEPFRLSHIVWKKDFADVGDYDPMYTRKTNIERRKEFVFDAKQIAEDLCQQINNNGPGEASFFGVFVCEGEEPTEAELEKARKRLEAYFTQCIAAADVQWSANPRHDLISGIAKRAVRFLNLDPSDYRWMSVQRKTVECPACGSRVKPGVAVCLGCGAILDEAKARQFGLIADKAPKEKPAKVI